MAILPDLRWPDALERWREAESRGVATAWTYDHLSWRSLRDSTWLGTIPLLAAVAACTEHIRLGTLVATPNFRHPATLAKEAMTLDEISAGRLDLGLGAGGTGYDATALGEEPITPAERAARFEEFVDAVDLMLREPISAWDGRFYRAPHSRTVPGSTQCPRVPFTIAAGGPRALRVAARHGSTWVTTGPPQRPVTAADFYAALDRQRAGLDHACAGAGRDPAGIRRAVVVGLDLAWAQSSVAAWDDFCGHIAARGFTDAIVHWPRPDDPELPGPPPAVFDEIVTAALSGAEPPS